jgi:protein required for attachment to host cells
MKRLGLIIADATRARIFFYQRLVGPAGPVEQLVEERDLVDPARRARDGAAFADDPGRGHAGDHGFGFDDHREAHRDVLDHRFAREIVIEAGRVMADHGLRDLVVIASPRMLGRLRAELEPLHRTYAIRELDRDLTQLPLVELRDHLAALAVLPAPILAAQAMGS